MRRRDRRWWLCLPALAVLPVAPARAGDAALGIHGRGSLLEHVPPPETVAAPGPPFPCSGPGNQLCAGASGPCDAPHAAPGCADPCCCTVVCEGLPLCCILTWDTACVIAAIEAGCAALDLCQAPANCQVYGDLSASNSTTHPDPDPDEFLSADDFTPAASASITSVCWQGLLAMLQHWGACP